MVIGLDYDFTYTEDPIFWNTVIALATERMHKVVCVTGRKVPPSDHEPQLPRFEEIICAGDEFKRHAAAKAGHRIDVWIDDCPGTIEPQRKLDW